MDRYQRNKTLRKLVLKGHNKFARLFHAGSTYYEIVITEKDEYGSIVRTKSITGDCVRHAKAQFRLWTNFHYPPPPEIKEMYEKQIAARNARLGREVSGSGSEDQGTYRSNRFSGASC